MRVGLARDDVRGVVDEEMEIVIRFVSFGLMN